MRQLDLYDKVLPMGCEESRGRIRWCLGQSQTCRHAFQAESVFQRYCTLVLK